MRLPFLQRNSVKEVPATAPSGAQRPSKVKVSDLPIALYLNQRVTFDILAILEDGFAHMTTLHTSSSSEESAGLEAGAQLGIANPFAFLGLSLGAKGRLGTINESAEVTTEQLFHTPTSLFARLRQELFQLGLVEVVQSNQVDFEKIRPGQFIEFEAVLRRSPIVSLLDTFVGLAPFAEAFGSPIGPPNAISSNQRKGSSNRKGQGRRGAQTKPKRQPIEGLAEAQLLRDAVTAAGSEYLVAECGEHRFVLTAENPYFVDSTMNDVIDGTFRVLGKVTRVVPEGTNESIGLLRRSALGQFGEAVGGLAEAFASLPEAAGFSGQADTEIPAPTIQLIPICIFA